MYVAVISMANNVIDAKMVTSTIRIACVSIFLFLRFFRVVDQTKLIKYLRTNFADCDCDLQGTVSEVCEKQSGQCLCKEGFGGPRCDKCLPGYYNYPDCQPCNCSILGSVSTICDASGKCPCLASFAGKQCTQCSTGYYAYPECLRKCPYLHVNVYRLFDLLKDKILNLCSL